MCKMMISEKDLSDNIMSIRRHITVPIIAVVKMNGYGITTRYAVDAWYKSGIRLFAVSTTDEAFELLALGYTDIKILLMSPVHDEKLLCDLIRQNVILTIVSKQNADIIRNAAEGLKMKVRAHVKIDVGMGRFGVKTSKKDELILIYKTPGIIFDGIFAHFSCAFEKKYDQTKKQFEEFKSVLSFLNDAKIEYGFAHIASSCAAIRFKETWLDAVRIGSALIGRLPVQTELNLKKIGTLEASVIDIKELERSDTVGYAQQFTAPKSMRAAVLDLGHRSGFGLIYRQEDNRLSSLIRTFYYDVLNCFNPMHVSFKGQKLKVIGRIGDQYTHVDVSDCDIKINDSVDVDIRMLLVSSSVKRVIV